MARVPLSPQAKEYLERSFSVTPCSVAPSPFAPPPGAPGPGAPHPTRMERVLAILLGAGALLLLAQAALGACAASETSSAACTSPGSGDPAEIAPLVPPVAGAALERRFVHLRRVVQLESDQRAERGAWADAPAWAATGVAAAALLAAARGKRCSRCAAAKHSLSEPHPQPRWTCGVASRRGQVRAENQDAAAALSVGETHAILLADGLGGEPLGGVASRIAVERAAQDLAASLRRLPYHPSPSDLLSALRASFRAAGEGLAREAGRRGRKLDETGLRTTLLAALAREDAFAWAYQGDGGIYLVGAEGACESFLVPPREPSGELLACLGPEPTGEVVAGLVGRPPGSLLVLASDGVADRVSPAFGPALLEMCRKAAGDLGQVASDVLEELESVRAGGSFVFDDNLTLGLLGTPESPSGGSSVSRRGPSFPLRRSSVPSRGAP